MNRFLSLLLIACLLVLPSGAAGQEPETTRYDPYFDDAVFIGDSITHQLHTYVLGLRKEDETAFPGLRFLHSTSYTISAALRTRTGSRAELTYRGRAVTVRDALKRMDAGKVLLMLGINDHAGKFMETDVDRYSRLIDLVKAAAPCITIIAVSVTPMTQNGQKISFKQHHVDAFNERLKQLTQEKGILYLDLASPLKDEAGFLNLSYSSDDEIHFNKAGLAVVVTTLRRFAQAQFESGAWAPEGGSK